MKQPVLVAAVLAIAFLSVASPVSSKADPVQTGALLTSTATSTPVGQATPLPTGGVGTGVVKMLLFYSPTCPHCQEVIQNFFPKVREQYGDRIQVAALSVEDNAVYSLMLAIEEKAAVPEDRRGYVPTMIVGQYLFVGADTIEQGLGKAIDEYLAAGGVEYPVPEEYLATPTPVSGSPAAVTVGTPTVAPAPTGSSSSGDQPIAMAYFYKVGCRECDRVTYDVKFLQSSYPQLQAEVFDVDQNAPLNEWLCEQYGVPVEKRLTTPIVFIGGDYLLGDQVTLKNIEGLIQRYAKTGAEPRWKNWEAHQEEAGGQIVQRFKSMGPFAVVAAALIDGLNPCAFATLILFISYLALTGRKKGEIILVGLAFTFGVFLTYFLVGVGILKFLAAMPFLKTLGKWIYGFTAVLCLGLAVVSLVDYLKARQGRASEMTLRLPLRLRRLVNRVVRENVGAGAFAATAFATGAVVSLIELACTGQVYLPTILFVLGMPDLRASAVGYLLLYNFIFVVPLIVIFALAYFGTASEKLTVFLSRHTATIKLATGFLFLLLAVGLALYLV